MLTIQFFYVILHRKTIKNLINMKNFTIDYDITMSGCLDVEANTKEEARQIALKKLSEEPYYFARRAMAHVNTEITDIY